MLRQMELNAARASFTINSETEDFHQAKTIMSSLIEWHNRIPDSGFHIHDSSVDPSNAGQFPIIDYYEPTEFLDENGVPCPGVCDDINKAFRLKLKKDCRKTGIDTLGELTYPPTNSPSNSSDDFKGFNFPHSKQRASLPDSDDDSVRSFDINSYEEKCRDTNYDSEYPPLESKDCRILCTLAEMAKRLQKSCL